MRARDADFPPKISRRGGGSASRVPMTAPETPSPTAPAAADSGVVLFDGVCNLCNSAVQFIIRRDPRAKLKFAPLDSPTARGLLGSAEFTGSLPDSIILVEGGPDSRRITTQSTAVLRIAKRLRGPWPLAYALIVIPKPLRDWAYRFIARNRYRWFGKRESCMLPTPELRDRFL